MAHRFFSLVLASAFLVGACSSAGSNKPGQVSQNSSGTDGGQQEDTCASDMNYTPFSLGMTATNAGLTVKIESDPPMPVLGDHSTWKLTITDANGPVAAGTKVTVKCTMTHSGFSHGCPAPIGVKEVGNGVYEASPVIFNMQGHWHVDFGIGTSYVPIELCLE